MDLCQHVSYRAHIVQVQLRISDGGPSPLTAHPTICSPGGLGGGSGGLAPLEPGVTVLPSVNLQKHTQRRVYEDSQLRRTSFFFSLFFFLSSPSFSLFSPIFSSSDFYSTPPLLSFHLLSFPHILPSSNCLRLSLSLNERRPAFHSSREGEPYFPLTV